MRRNIKTKNDKSNKNDGRNDFMNKDGLASS